MVIDTKKQAYVFGEKKAKTWVKTIERKIDSIDYWKVRDDFNSKEKQTLLNQARIEYDQKQGEYSRDDFIALERGIEDGFYEEVRRIKEKSFEIFLTSHSIDSKLQEVQQFGEWIGRSAGSHLAIAGFPYERALNSYLEETFGIFHRQTQSEAIKRIPTEILSIFKEAYYSGLRDVHEKENSKRERRTKMFSI